MTTFSDLPTEILLNIIQFIHPQTLLAFALANRGCYKLSKPSLEGYQRYSYLTTWQPPRDLNTGSLLYLIDDISGTPALGGFVLRVDVRGCNWEMAYCGMKHEEVTEEIRAAFRTEPWTPSGRVNSYGDYFLNKLVQAGSPVDGSMSYTPVNVLVGLLPLMPRLQSFSIAIGSYALSTALNMVRKTITHSGGLLSSFSGCFSNLCDVQVTKRSKELRDSPIFVHDILLLLGLPTLRVLHAEDVSSYSRAHPDDDTRTALAENLQADLIFKAPLEKLTLEQCHLSPKCLGNILSVPQASLLQDVVLYEDYHDQRSSRYRPKESLEGLIRYTSQNLRSLEFRVSAIFLVHELYQALRTNRHLDVIDDNMHIGTAFPSVYSIDERTKFSVFTNLLYLEVDAHLLLRGYGMVEKAQSILHNRIRWYGTHSAPGLGFDGQIVEQINTEKYVVEPVDIAILLPKSIVTLKIHTLAMQRALMLQSLRAVIGSLAQGEVPRGLPSLREAYVGSNALHKDEEEDIKPFQRAEKNGWLHWNLDCNRGTNTTIQRVLN